MYNGQKNSHNQIGQIKQNKIIASDYSRPRKGSYCQYKQQKLTANSIIPFSSQKEDFTNAKRSSLGFYDHGQINKPNIQSRLQKYSSKQFNENQMSTIHNSQRGFNLNFKSRNNDDQQYQTQPKYYKTERFHQSYDNIPRKKFGIQEIDRFPSDGLIKQESKRLNKYINQNYQSQAKYDRVYEKNKDPSVSKIYKEDHISFRYQENNNVKRNQKPIMNQNYGKAQLNDIYFQPYRQNILQVERYQGIENQKTYFKAQKPNYQMDQYRRNLKHLTFQQKQRQNVENLDNYFESVQTSTLPPSRFYCREKNISLPMENNFFAKKDIALSQEKFNEHSNYEKNIGTPNRSKYNGEQKLEKNLSNSRRDHLISKSKILRQKMNELSAEKNLIGSISNSQYEENKNQTYQERLQRLKNNKNRVYQSPFKQTIRSASNLQMRYCKNAQSQIVDKSNNQQKKGFKTQQHVLSHQNRQNIQEQPKLDRKAQGYGPHENNCMDRISLLNSKINEKISSIISSYGRPSH